MFVRNMNVFIACLAIGQAVVVSPLAIAIHLLGKPLVGGWVISRHSHMLGYLLIAAVLAVFWWRTGLSPAQAARGREGRFNAGHWLLGIFNLLAVLSFVGPMLLAKASGNGNLMMLAWLALPVFALGMLAWPIGLFLVWSSGSGPSSASRNLTQPPSF